MSARGVRGLVQPEFSREGATMGRWWKDLDRILRGDATRVSSLTNGTIDVPIGGLAIVLVLLGMFYGMCMGCFALFKAEGPTYLQLVASTLKVPSLFMLTLGITLPSLYVFNALVGSRLMLDTVLRLLLAALAVTLAVLASLGPIVAFFSVSTNSHPFMVLVNVVVVGVSGSLGLSFLLQTLHRLSLAPILPPPSLGPDEPGEEKSGGGVPVPGALEPMEGQVLGKHVTTIFRCWVVLFGLVGAQMGWVLRPFVGNPNVPFEWFRGRESNFFQGVWHALAGLFS
jgi:hypothetical protein